MNPESGKNPTLADIARIAGVAESTVSRALSNSPLVSRATRERVQEIAQQLNYRVNLSARNLRLRSTRTIALLLPVDPEFGQMTTDVFCLDLIGGIADALWKLGYDLLLATTGVHPEHWRQDFIGESRADGLIIVGQAFHTRELDQIARSNTPAVVWGALLPGQRYCSIGSDNEGGGYHATEHLLGLGRRRILFLGNVQFPEVALRHRGHVTAVRDAGLQPDPALTVPCALTRTGAMEAMSSVVLGTGLKYDAIFAASDVLAMTAIQVLHRQGLRVPDDVAVVGYDDVHTAESFSPALTTISQNIRTGGQQLVSKLMRRLDGETIYSETLPTELIVRESCGAKSSEGA